jgi:SAM-dependent methyltransferase
MARERRLTFGDVAEQYDERRPSYPPELVDDVLEFAGAGSGSRALEVGAGTGKATVLFAERGLRVDAIEPNAAMAAVARRNCFAWPGVTVQETDFESWEPGDVRFELVFSAQAWHWVTPEVRFVKARAALSTGGALATFWNGPVWEGNPMTGALRAAYETAVPDFGPRPGPMHPYTTWDPSLWGDWNRELQGVEGFGPLEPRRYDWTVHYSTADYIALIGTHSDHIVLPDDRRAALFAEISSVLDAAGGGLTTHYATLLWMTRAGPVA